MITTSQRFWLDLGRRLARLPSPSVCPALLVPAHLVSHTPAAAAALPVPAALDRPYIQATPVLTHASRQSSLSAGEIVRHHLQNGGAAPAGKVVGATSNEGFLVAYLI